MQDKIMRIDNDDEYCKVILLRLSMCMERPHQSVHNCEIIK